MLFNPYTGEERRCVPLPMLFNPIQERGRSGVPCKDFGKCELKLASNKDNCIRQIRQTICIQFKRFNYFPPNNCIHLYIIHTQKIFNANNGQSDELKSPYGFPVPTKLK